MMALTMLVSSFATALMVAVFFRLLQLSDVEQNYSDLLLARERRELAQHAAANLIRFRWRLAAQKERGPRSKIRFRRAVQQWAQARRAAAIASNKTNEDSYEETNRQKDADKTPVKQLHGLSPAISVKAPSTRENPKSNTSRSVKYPGPTPQQRGLGQHRGSISRLRRSTSGQSFVSPVAEVWLYLL